jgi:tetratricopeptide (TPR) repeat protein
MGIINLWVFLLLSSFLSAQQSVLKIEKELSPQKKASLIFKQEVKPMLEVIDTCIKWKNKMADLKRKYNITNDTISNALEDKFRDAVDVFIKRAIINNDSQIEPDWTILAGKLKKTFIKYDYKQLLLENKLNYFSDKKQREKCEETSMELLNKYGANLSDNQLNDITWYGIFLYSNDKNNLLEAARWMKISVERLEDAGHYDTYANLLYKMGLKDKAILWENKAIDMAVRKFLKVSIQRDLKANLEKMEKGEKTWMN